MERFLKGKQPSHSLSGAMCVVGERVVGVFPTWTLSLSLELALQSRRFLPPTSPVS